MAFTYAHAFASAYPGGRFLLPCDGKTNLRDAALHLGDLFRDRITDEERMTAETYFAAIATCLRERLDTLGHILLVLDNVSDLRVVSREQTDLLTSLGPKLHLLATTRLAAHPEVTCAAFLERLGLEDLEALDALADDTDTELRRHNHERRVEAVLGPNLAALRPFERRAIEFAALLPADMVALPWRRELTAVDIPELNEPPRPGPQSVVPRYWYELAEWSRAEPLMRLALAIDEWSYGTDHGYVARDLNNLALLFRSTNRLAEAEPGLMKTVNSLYRVLLRGGALI